MIRRERAAPAEGFSLVELVISIALMLIVTATVFSIADPSRGAFQAQLESSDVQQRLRVAADRLSQDLKRAGAGVYAGPETGPLTYWLPPLLPYRYGMVAADPPGSYKSDTISILLVPATASQTILSSPVGPGRLTLHVDAAAGCPEYDDLCGFTSGMMLAIYDDYGRFDLFVLASTAVGSGQLEPVGPLETRYEAGARVVAIEQRTYARKFNAAQGFHQLASYDGSGNPDVPVVDHLVALEFRYYGSPQPPVLRKPLTDPKGPWTSYGPKPPPLDETPTDYPLGENCVFRFDSESGLYSSRLPVLAAGDALVELAAAELSDGVSWCPDAVTSNRFDADVLRIRKIAVRIRVESAIDALRGPAGVLFSRAGTARAGNRFVPDRETRFEITPKNLNPAP